MSVAQPFVPAGQMGSAWLLCWAELAHGPNPAPGVNVAPFSCAEGS